jgi:hypothetical protein
MAGESQQTPRNEPDPTVLTTQQLERGLGSERDYVDGQIAILEQRIAAMDTATRLLNETVNRVPTDLQTAIKNINDVFDIRLQALNDISDVREAYRLELKGDAKEALTTALAAAEKAVQAALAAAEKARDQQTIASQLATDKAEKAFVEALGQQQQTFTVAIANVVEGVNEVKQGLSDIRSEQRGGRANQAAIYAAVGFGLTVLLIVGIVAGLFATRG